MGDRRNLLGTGAVLVGMGTALVSGAAVAAADTGDADSNPQTGAEASAGASASQPSRSTSAASTHRVAPRTSTARNGDSGASAPAASRLPRAGAALRPRTSGTANDSAPTVAVPAVTVPGPPLPAAGQTAAPVLRQAPERAQARAVVTTARNGVVESVAAVTPAPFAAAATPEVAPMTSALLTAMSALGWGPGGDPVAGEAAPAAATAQRVGSRTASVVGTAAAVAAAPPDPLLPTISNGVTGVQIGHSQLAVPGALIGNTVDADWYFPTQADGTVDAQGVIWLQHGFGATNTFYSALAQQLAQNTNSIVVAPTLSSIPFTLSGGCLICSATQQAAAAAFLDPNRTALVNSAVAAGYTGSTSELLGKFALAGHSAGGGFATAVASDYINSGTTAEDANLVGVVMYDGVSNGVIDGSFDAQIAALDAANKPVYQIAAPAQSWNLFGATTNALAADRPGDFVGVVLQNGSHVDSMLGVNPLFDAILQLVTKQVPAGNTNANYTLSTGWINDMYNGITPTAGDALQQGLYAAANQQIVMGSALAYGLPSIIANQVGPIEGLVEGVFKAVGGLFGLTLPPAVNDGNNGLNPATPVVQVGNGATGVRVGAATLDIPCNGNFYAAPATWYFPTQADGTVAANGVIWLQHGFLGFDPWYSDMAEALAQKTNSIVVAPSIFWFDTPLCPGCYLGSTAIREGASTMFSDGRVQLTNSARATGLFDGTLPDKFVLTGHSAGGNFATAVGALITQTDQVDNLLGVVMFDGVSRDPQLTDQLTLLNAAGKPDYQIAAPPQRWNAFGVANDIMENFFVPKDQFYGLQIDNGSHTDVIGGTGLFAQLASVASALIVKPSPPGGKEAVRTLAVGWINDIYNGNTTYSAGGFTPANGLQYGTYGPSRSITPQQSPVADQPVAMGQAGATVMPAPPAVVVNPDLPPTQNYLGTWYEQGSVRQFFSIGLVNTKAVYSLNADGSIKVQNSGNYFGPNGPSSAITGAAVPIPGSNNTRLNVGFAGQPSADNPGNYWIIDRGTFSGNTIVGGDGYDWAIVSDPSGGSGFLLTRPQTITEAQYGALVARAYALGVNGLILRTQQYPSSAAAV